MEAMTINAGCELRGIIEDKKPYRRRRRCPGVRRAGSCSLPERQCQSLPSLPEHSDRRAHFARSGSVNTGSECR
jgi:hypothetical protein